MKLLSRYDCAIVVHINQFLIKYLFHSKGTDGGKNEKWKEIKKIVSKDVLK